MLLEALVLGLLGSTIGLGLGVLLAIGIRSLFAQFGLDLSGQPLIMAPKTVLAAYAVGVIVTMGAAFFPARRTTKIAPVQAMRDDIAMPESSLRRRFLIGVVLMLAGGAALAAGLVRVGAAPALLRRRRHPGDPARRRLRQPGHQLPAARGRGLALQPPLRLHRRAGRPELAAQPAPYDRDVLGADDRPVARVHDGDRRRLGQGERRPDDRGELRRRLRRQQPRRAELLDEIGRADGGRPRRRERVGAALRHRQLGGDGQGIGAAEPATMRDGFKIDMVEGDLADLADGTVVVDETYADEEGLALGDDVDGAARRRRARDGGRRPLRGEPDPLLPDRHHAARP